MAIYFDNSATTQPFDFVADGVHKYMLESFYNPSALYAPAMSIHRDIQDVRSAFASDLRVHEDEILFTSGGTESNNTAILGIALSFNRPVHIITSAIEHASIYEIFRYLERRGHSVTYLPCDSSGTIIESALIDALRSNTALVSIMHVNNEVGSVMDIAGLGLAIKRRNPRCVFHVDGVQAYPKILADLSDVDLYSISGHKFHAPRGTGVLMRKRSCTLQPILSGGGQEYGYRGGTENAFGIIGLGEAQRYYVQHREAIINHFLSMKYRLLDGLKQLEGIWVNGPEMENAAPHILSISFEGIQGQSLVHALDEKQIYVGTGSACSSHKKNANRILASMGVSPRLTQGTIRFSFGCMNTEEECDIVAREVIEAVTHLRRFQRR